jgi:hypothetical protein
MVVSGYIHAPVALSPGKEPLVRIGEGAGWAPEQVWTRWWKENSQPLPVQIEVGGEYRVTAVLTLEEEIPVPIG